MAMLLGFIMLMLTLLTPSEADNSTFIRRSLNCSTPYNQLTPCSDLQSKCRAPIGGLIPCLKYLEGEDLYPDVICCAALRDTEKKFPACLCHVTFYPPGNISHVLQEAMPFYCNITTKLCDVCPAMLGVAPGGNSCSLGVSVGRVLSIVAASVTAVLIALLVFCIWLACRRKKRAWKFPDSSQERDEILKIEGKPTLFTYGVMKAATKNFHPGCKLGEGGFGAVFKVLTYHFNIVLLSNLHSDERVLPDGTEVAVKQLSASSRQGKEEFLNEVQLITGVQHRNLVKLRGCCLKGDERLLVYEYLENKSLNQALFGDERESLKLDWQARLKILVGTARGLAYLHEGCQTRIIHRDIKASNILLDKDLIPKIADFGLARFFLDDQSHVSTRVAGTVGYLAPEYAMRGQLTEKADVFSFGIVALELVSGRGNLDLRLPADMAYLLDWTWQLHEEKKLMELVDPSAKDGTYSEEEALRVIEVALLCTQSVASMRPSMTRVVTMLTGDAEIAIPEISKPRLRLFTDALAPGTSARANSSFQSKRDFSQPSDGPVSRSSMTSSNAGSYISNIEPR